MGEIVTIHYDANIYPFFKERAELRLRFLFGFDSSNSSLASAEKCENWLKKLKY